MESPVLSLSPTPELEEAEHNDATDHPLENPDPKAMAGPVDADINDQDQDLEEQEEQEEEERDVRGQARDTTDNARFDDSDADSILSDVDEAQFEDFDPNQITIDDRPAIAVDEDNVKLLGRHKRKRDGDGMAGEEQPKKKKEGRREKSKKSRRRAAESDEDNFSGGQEIEGKRKRKAKPTEEGGARAGAERRPRARTPEDESQLDPEERRRRALDRAIDAAIKGPAKRRPRAGGIDLASAADDEIANLRIRMAEAAQADGEARNARPPRPAMHKLKLLPEVTALLNRNNRDVESAIVDPENNLLESVRLFLEPLIDGSLPAYNIQRELFSSLSRLPIDKESLISSGLGKVVLFYTKSKRPELNIKRAAERLLGEWTRPILKRSDDYRKRVLETAEFDPHSHHRGNHVMSEIERAQAQRKKELELPLRANRARAEIVNRTYTIVPRATQVSSGAFARPLGASGDDAFRRMKARQQAMAGPRRA